MSADDGGFGPGVDVLERLRRTNALLEDNDPRTLIAVVMSSPSLLQLNV